MRPWIVGNWKMNGLGADLVEAANIAQALTGMPAKAQAAICAPATLVERLARMVQGTPLLVGGEDLHAEDGPSLTGDVTARMLAEAGATVVIVGHSERRRAYGETDATVAHKALAALHGGLTPIICVGETQAERDAGQALAVVCRQVAESTPRDLAEHPFILAYEPIWAIGSGHPPKPEQIEQMHHAIRGAVIDAVGDSGAGVPILYGGSVDPDNAGGILAVSEVGGALVGGASLKAEDFLEILRAAG